MWQTSHHLPSYFWRGLPLWRCFYRLFPTVNPMDLCNIPSSIFRLSWGSRNIPETCTTKKTARLDKTLSWTRLANWMQRFVCLDVGFVQRRSREALRSVCALQIFGVGASWSKQKETSATTGKPPGYQDACSIHTHTHAGRNVTQSNQIRTHPFLTPTVLNNNKPEKRERVCRKTPAKNSSALWRSPCLAFSLSLCVSFFFFCVVSVSFVSPRTIGRK